MPECEADFQSFNGRRCSAVLHGEVGVQPVCLPVELLEASASPMSSAGIVSKNISSRLSSAAPQVAIVMC